MKAAFTIRKLRAALQTGCGRKILSPISPLVPTESPGLAINARQTVVVRRAASSSRVALDLQTFGLVAIRMIAAIAPAIQDRRRATRHLKPVLKRAVTQPTAIPLSVWGCVWLPQTLMQRRSKISGTTPILLPSVKAAIVADHNHATRGVQAQRAARCLHASRSATAFALPASKVRALVYTAIRRAIACPSVQRQRTARPDRYALRRHAADPQGYAGRFAHLSLPAHRDPRSRTEAKRSVAFEWPWPAFAINSCKVKRNSPIVL